MGRRLLILTALAALAATGRADQLSLTDGGRLTGSVTSMRADGTLTMSSDLAPTPLTLDPAHIRRVDFEGALPAVADHDARVRLVNDDLIPCDVIAITPASLTLRTAFAGDLAVPRELVSHMQLGIRPRRLILSGIGEADAWAIQQDAWRGEEGALISSGTGSAGRDLADLPDSFSLSFLLTWQQNPSFKVFFCSDSDEGSRGKLDRYFLQFNTAGFELKRQSTGQIPYHTLGTVNRGPETFRGREVRIDLRVDRPSRMIHLYLDGQLEGRFPDQLDDIPQAGGLVFESGSKTDDGHRVSELAIRHWDASGDRHTSEDRGDPNADAVIDHDGQRFSGTLLETAKRGDQLVVLFRSPHLEAPMEIPLDRISTVFLASPRAETENPPLHFGIGDRGRISAASGRFDRTHLHLRHPLLGDLTIDRTAVASLDRREVGKAAPEEEPDSPDEP